MSKEPKITKRVYITYVANEFVRLGSKLRKERNKQQPLGFRTQGPNQKHVKIKFEWACDMLGPRKERKKNRVGLGCTRPKNGGVSVIRKMVKLISVSVSVCEKP